MNKLQNYPSEKGALSAFPLTDEYHLGIFYMVALS